MATYRVTYQGQVVLVYQGPPQLTFDQWPGCTQEVMPDQPPEPEPPAYTGPWRITKLAFINRFTDAEWVAFDLAALDNPSGTLAQRQQKSAMRLYMRKVELAQFIDLQRADTRAGVQSLEAAGILAQGRAAVILDTAPTEEELWRG